ncbi:MAG: tetratricopeptide repeat protein, partial [Xanthomonadales bacterium]|nr:tetratricopeptide repeat protein [Xanthomonadales bacterium]
HVFDLETRRYECWGAAAGDGDRDAELGPRFDQPVGIAWDARPAEQGGQRWFSFRDDAALEPGDVLHWTGPNANWNSMCADCHSTGFRKGYDASGNSFTSRWAEINVGCEACHGPGADHVAWARERGEGPLTEEDVLGLALLFDERDGVSWAAGADGLPVRSTPRTTGKEIATCARCHSRRGQFADAPPAGHDWLDAYLPAVVQPGLYHPDGQPADETYVWGSFMQSRMQHAGVTCSDCHDPHRAALRLEGNATCTQCHSPTTFDTPAHHHHEAGSTGAECAACHMPQQTFMGVDARHEHVFRVPRPAESAALGAPDACTDCHEDRSAQWAAESITAWRGSPQPGDRLTQALAAAWRGERGAAGRLRAISVDPDEPVMRRAAAIRALAPFVDADTVEAWRRALRSDDPLLRLAALQALVDQPAQVRILAFPLLEDSSRALRATAARLFADLPPGELEAGQREALNTGLSDWLAMQEYNAERPEALSGLGAFHEARGQPDKAEAAYRLALERQPRYVPARVNLSTLLGRAGREAEARAVVEEGLELLPGQPDLAYAAALSAVRSGDVGRAVPLLRTAVAGAPAEPRYRQALALALEREGQLATAIDELEALLSVRPDHAESRVLLAMWLIDSGQPERASPHVEYLLQAAPGDPMLLRLQQALQQSLEQAESR